MSFAVYIGRCMTRTGVLGPNMIPWEQHHTSSFLLGLGSEYVAVPYAYSTSIVYGVRSKPSRNAHSTHGCEHHRIDAGEGARKAPCSYSTGKTIYNLQSTLNTLPHEILLGYYLSSHHEIILNPERKVDLVAKFVC